MEIEMEDTDIQITEILDAFKIYDGIYKRNQVDAAIDLKESITPHLIKILEEVLNDPDQYIKNENLYGHIYALMLIGHFKELSAHKLIVDLFSLPGDITDLLYGDICTSDLPTILFNTCGGDLEQIKAMILNKEVDDYTRISACQALAYSVVEGYVSRKEVVEFFGNLFTGNETDEASDFWGLLASIACDLYPEEIMDVIKESYENGLIMPGLIGQKHFGYALDMGEEECLERLQQNREDHNLDDLHRSMSWWACFDENEIQANTPAPNLAQDFKKAQKKKTKTKKKKRKQVKASKKKNRR